MKRTRFSIFNNKDFFPTPREIVLQILSEVEIEGKVIFEPSCGKGNIIDVLKQYKPKQIIACEIHKELSKIAETKADKFLKHNFFEVSKSEISHVDFIIMNPPFSQDEKHILHAWEIAPDGCIIISLCNTQTIQNQFSSYRKTFGRLLNDFGKYVNLGDCFAGAERTTGVEVSLIHLYKPKKESNNEFEGYFDLSEEYEKQENGVLKFNEIRDIVNRYVGAVKEFQNTLETNQIINTLIKPIGNDNIVFGAFEKRNGTLYGINRENFKKSLQKNAWNSVFKRMNMQKYVTESVMADINKFVEQQENVPFTMKNIYKMFEIIVGTQAERMDRVITEVFDKITMHYHENRYSVEGWKTNDQWMVNKKFILPYIIEVGFSGQMQCRYHTTNTMNDLYKALCHVTGTQFDHDMDWWQYMNNKQKKEFGVWHDWVFFLVKGFKKGTLHVQFKDEKVWEKFNLTAAKAKGWQLPETTIHNFRKK